MDLERLHADLQKIVRDTEVLGFPIFSSFERKQEILRETRAHVDAQLEKVLADAGLSCNGMIENRSELWTKADKAARKEFGNLSEKEMLNSFYLQEVMHRYAELQIAKATEQYNL